MSMYTICVGETERVSSKYSQPNMIQLSLLERSFAVCSFPNKTMLRKLVLETGLNEQKIIDWFGYRRQNEECGEYYVCSYM